MTNGPFAIICEKGDQYLALVNRKLTQKRWWTGKDPDLIFKIKEEKVAQSICGNLKLNNPKVVPFTEAKRLIEHQRRREVGSKSRPLAYAARFMKEEITKLRQGAPEPSFVRHEDVMLMDRETALWKARLTVWHSRGHWEANWGPKPGEPGCQVPPKMLNATRGNAAE